MPTLTWIGKDKVVNHHHDVPYSVLKKKYVFEAPSGTPANSTNNRIIHGDNLAVLKSLLPEFEGRVNCIYIDPPYNTGNEEWVYNDNVNDPRIKKWLGDIVGKEGEDLTRHDKWLCMMYPRLKLLHRLLAEDGVIALSIDHNEVFNLKSILDEAFGSGNFLGNIIWKNVTDNNPTRISIENEYVLVYAKNKSKVPEEWKAENVKTKDVLMNVYRDIVSSAGDINEARVAYEKWYRLNKAYIWPFQDYKFLDDKGIYAGSRSVHNPGKDGYRYDVIHPKTKKPCVQPLMGYRFPLETMMQLVESGRIIYGEDENKIIELKIYVQDYRMKLSSVLELDGRKGTNELKDIFPESKKVFDYPKSSDFIEELLSYLTNKNSIVLDSFAGSATTAHAVLKLNAQDGGNRRFILCEMMDYAESITAERVRRVMTGYGKGSKAVEGLGGAFTYQELGEPLFNGEFLNESVGVSKIRQYVAYSENIPLDKRCEDSPVSPYLLGINDDTSWIFYYEPDRETTLDAEFLGSLKYRANGFNVPAHSIIYADTCVLTHEQLERFGLRFKKIPRDITRL